MLYTVEPELQEELTLQLKRTREKIKPVPVNTGNLYRNDQRKTGNSLKLQANNGG
jgi:hypothetical protein